VFWNLLQRQAPGRVAGVPLLAATSARLSQHDACFYFGSVRLLSYGEHPIAKQSLAATLHLTLPTL